MHTYTHAPSVVTPIRRVGNVKTFSVADEENILGAGVSAENLADYLTHAKWRLDLPYF